MTSSKPDKAKVPQRFSVVRLKTKGDDGTVRHVEIRRDELVRRAMAAQIAKHTVHLALHVHRTESGRPVSLDAQWRQIYADPAPDRRIIAAAQRGKTTFEIVSTMAEVSLGLAVGWVLTKESKVGELNNGKLTPTIKNTPFYAELQAMSGTQDATSFKRFGPHGKLYLVTANSVDELTSFSADVMHVDERDFCNRTNLPMYPSRMNASPYKLTREISTPTIEGNERVAAGSPGNDNIHSEWLAGTQQRYYVPCDRCGWEQIVSWEEHFIDIEYDDTGRIVNFKVRDQDWSPGSPRDIRAMCTKCTYPMDRLNPGIWRPNRPKRAIQSYWTEALCTEIGPSMEKLFNTFSRALGNPSKMQHFVNMDLGRPFTSGVLRFNEEMFNRCVQKGHHIVDRCEWPTTMGMDVNRPFLDYQISRWINGYPVKMYAGRLNGGKDEVMALIKRFNVKGGVIDHQPETKFSMAIQDAAGELGVPIVRCKYATQEQSRMVVVSEKGENPAIDPPRLITVDRTMAIDTLYESMWNKSITWFEEWASAMDGLMFAEMNRPVRMLRVNESGAERYIWDGTPDHQLHAGVYDLMAGLVLGFDQVRDYSDVMPEVNIISGSNVPAADSTKRPTNFDELMAMAMRG